MFTTSETIIAPSHWSSYLINGDASGITEEERAHADAWIDRHGVLDVVACDDSDYFTWHYQVHDPLSEVLGGNVCDFVCIVR